MTEFPRGLQSPTDIPQQLVDVEFALTTFTSLPERLSPSMPTGTVCALEHSQLKQYSEALIHAKPAFCSVAYNHIERVPLLAFEQELIDTIILSMNFDRSLIRPGLDPRNNDGISAEAD